MVRPDEIDDDESQAAAETELSAGTERAFVRLTFWQTVLSLVGVFIAVVALYAALAESDAARKQTAAAVWPFVQLTIHDHLSEAGAEFRISLTNAGVGPARMRSMRVLLLGEPLRDWHEAMERLHRVPAEDEAKDFLTVFIAQHGRVPPTDWDGVIALSSK